jgi:beta-lactamase regulating signal transducer with metallopeptidase domain
MSWTAWVVNGLAHSAVGGTLFLAVGILAVRWCRQPIRRIRLIELTLLGTLALPVVSQLPWLPHWSTGLLQLSGLTDQPRDDEQSPGPAERVAVQIVAAPEIADPATSAPERAAPRLSRVEQASLITMQAPAMSVAELITAAYGIVVAVFLARYAASALTLLRLYRGTEPVPNSVRDTFREIAGPAGDRVDLRASACLELPVAFRGWRPIIVLPASLCRTADNGALRFSLAHEWSHVAGGDVSRWYWTGLVQLLYFFHPLYWWLRRQLRLCQDYLADASAAACARERLDYAEYLVGLARRRVHAPAAALGIGDRRSNLYRRIIMLLQSRDSLERRCLRTWTAGTFVVGLAVLLMCSFIRLDAAASGASADDKAPPPKEASTAPDKAETLHYTGRVFDKDTGKSIVGAIVTVRRSLLGDPELKERNPIMQETKHKTDENGKYSFTIPPEQSSKRYLYIELDVEHPDYAPRAHFGYALSMIRKNEKTGSRPFFESVEMRAGKPITGTVRTSDGQPAAGVKVQAYSVTNKRQDRFEYGSFTDCRTDAKGQFRLVVTTPGAAVVWLLPDNFAPSTIAFPTRNAATWGRLRCSPV